MSSPLFLTVTLCAQSSENESATPDESDGLPAASSPAREDRVTVEVARDRARMMHSIYAATLDVMHDRYFHGDRAIVPARAMEDVFFEIQRKSGAQARWIGVSLAPMSVDHEAESDFEKRASKEIAAGKMVVEVVEEGYYRRVGAIPLTSGCISCHAGFFRKPSKKPKFAGLVISVPVYASSVDTETP
ncbi:MAG: DUF3365 domain-containing protein [Fuerstiella sp.]|nr:DUF3365 domain-containing protein [Fuerstiella sp.]